MKRYSVTYDEVGGWREDLGIIKAETVSDALDIVEERFIATPHRVNTAGDCWSWNGTDYLASSEAHESDGFGYIDWYENSSAESLESDADYSWIVQVVR